MVWSCKYLFPLNITPGLIYISLFLPSYFLYYFLLPIIIFFEFAEFHQFVTLYLTLWHTKFIKSLFNFFLRSNAVPIFDYLCISLKLLKLKTNNKVVAMSKSSPSNRFTNFLITISTLTHWFLPVDELNVSNTAVS